MAKATEYTSGTLPFPGERPEWMSEEKYQELEDAYWNASHWLGTAEAAEKEARKARVTANQSVGRYERLLEEARGQLTIDDVGDVGGES